MAIKYLTNTVIFICLLCLNCYVDEYRKGAKEMAISFEQISTQFWGRSGAVYLYFNNKHWMIGGSETTSKNDVWNSDNGIDWICVQPNASFSPVRFHAGLVFDNKMWIFGGRGDTGNNFTSVYYSTDGITWTLATNTPGWNACHAMNMIVFDGKMWMFGGQRQPDAAAWEYRIFSSSDGINWTYRGDGAYGQREYSAIFVIGSYIYLISGFGAGGDGYKNDVWRSSDGINWTQISTGQFTTRYGQRGVFYDNKMWVVCGTNAGFINDVFSSSDGITWTELSIKINYIYYHICFAHENSIIMIGGYNNGISRINMDYVQPQKTENKCGGFFL